MDRSRCPACSASVRPDADWCSLCYLDLRRTAPPQRHVEPDAAVTSPTALQPTGGTVATTGRPLAPAAPSSPSGGDAGWPCTSCSAVVSLELDACPACGAVFLGRLGGDGGRHRVSSITAVSRFPRPARLAAGVAAGLLLALLLPVLLALLG